MLLIREVMHCKPGKVRPLVEKFQAMARIAERNDWGKMRILTDVAGERYWTLVAEIEVESLEEFMALGSDEATAQEFESIMKDYHDLVDVGRREIYNIER
jgi:hypothetical protein